MSDYEKKYKEALQVAKRKLCFDKAGMVDSFTPNDIYEMFPELKESDDERIRQELIAIYSVGARGNMKTGDIPDKDIVAWLEKQGEQKFAEGTFVNVDDVREDFIQEVYRVLDADSTNDRANQIIDAFDNLPTVTIEKQGVQPRYNIGDVICDKSCTTLNKEAQPNMEIVDIKNGMYICDKGSFPVSQQDEYELVGKRIDTKLNDDSVSNELRAASVKHAEKEMKNQTFPGNLEFELIYTFEEGAKWNAAQKYTWSEDDESMLFKVIHRIEQLDHYWNKPTDGKMITWLKSLKQKYTWKPSGVQMTVLDDVITNGHLPNVNQKILKGLQEQLRKLK